jgi:hypothetical protein
VASARLSGLLALEIPPTWWRPRIDREIRDLWLLKIPNAPKSLEFLDSESG